MANRNSETLFNELPEVNIERSRFDLGHKHTTTFNVGQIIPIEYQEVLPGDTFEAKTHSVLRLSTPITPFMDNLRFDTYWFFVPNRLVWKHWVNLFGENTESPWAPTIEYQTPQLLAPDGGWTEGTLADYLGIPTKVPNLSVDAMPFRAIAMIFNEWFRDENLTNFLDYTDGDETVQGSNGSNFITDVAKGGMPPIAAKLADRFTKALPEPQKGPDVVLPLGSSAPVYASNSSDSSALSNAAMRFKRVDGQTIENSRAFPLYAYGFGTDGLGASRVGTTAATGETAGVYPVNLMADLSAATASTINQLRIAFQVQKMYERDARSGSRMIELLRSHFGVVSDDARLQRPEYLGGSSVPFAVSQVVKTGGSDASSPLGETGAYSLTVDSNYDFEKSFSESGMLFCLGVARYKHSYQQGLEKKWTRKSRFDYYWPVFANLGEQAVLVKELYAQGTSEDDEVFGYQECWSEYRFSQNRVSGKMRSNATGSLDVWNLADNYSSRPYLSEAWIREDKANVDRVLTVGSSVSDQIIADFYFDLKAWRPLPAFSIPGLLDHH